MTPAYVAKLSLITQKTSIRTQKINSLLLETYSMTLSRFSFQDSLGRVQLFEKTFLLADTNIEVILRMLFLCLGNADVEFTKSRKLTQKSYETIKSLSTTSWVELIDKKIFAKAALDENSKIFTVYVAALEANKKVEMSIHRF